MKNHISILLEFNCVTHFWHAMYRLRSSNCQVRRAYSLCLFHFTFTFTTIQARPLYEAYVLGSVSVLTRCYCSVFNVHTPVLKALRLGAVTRKAGKAFHCSRVLGKKLYLRYVFLSRGTRNELECIFLECLLCGLSSLTISTSITIKIQYFPWWKKGWKTSGSSF